jgi:hypothetical protein
MSELGRHSIHRAQRDRAFLEDTMSNTHAPPVVERPPHDALDDTEGVLASVRTTREAASLFAECARESATTTVGAARHQVATHPYGALAAAAAVGFVVAGGLTSPMMWAFLRFGTRFAFAVVARRIGTALIEGAAESERATARPRASGYGTASSPVSA